MDLRTFVSETLQQIAEGIADAKAAIGALDIDARVNPGFVGEAEPTEVAFDVALTVSSDKQSASGEKASAAVGIVSVFTAKASGELTSAASGTERNEQVSRVKFSVKLAQPADLQPRPPQRPINYKPRRVV